MSTALVLRHPVPPTAPRHEDLIAEWAADLRLRGLSHNTIRNYCFDLGGFQQFLGRPLETATLPDLRAYGRSLLARQTSIATWARKATALREFYKWHRRREGHAVSIADDLEIPRRPKHVHRWWTDAQVRQFRRGFREGQPARLVSGNPRPADAPDRHNRGSPDRRPARSCDSRARSHGPPPRRSDRVGRRGSDRAPSA